MQLYSFRRVLTLFLASLLLLVTNSGWAASIKLDIEGVPGPVEDNIRLHFERLDKLPEDDSSAFHQQVEQTLLRSMQPLGYYQPEFSYAIRDQRLSLSIDAGPVVRWQQIQVSMTTQPAALPDNLAQALDHHDMEIGEPISHAQYDRFKKSLLTEFHKQGFLDARWQTSRLEVDVNTHQANVELLLEPGKRYRIQDIELSGTKIWRKTIDAMVPIQAGDWYNADDIAELYNSLLGSGYFDYANVEIDRQPPNQAVLRVDLTERSKDHFNTGIGYGTDTGPRAKLGWNRPQVNDRGDSIHSNLQVSSISKELTTEYRIPWLHPLERYLSWDTGLKQETTTDRESTLLSTGINFNRVRPRQWHYTYGVSLEDESYRQGDNPKEQVTYLLPNYHALRRAEITNNGEVLAKGKYWMDTLFGFSFLDNETRFFSVAIGASFAFNLFENHSLHPRFELGGIATEDIYSVPLSKRFYTGGDQTVRGFKYNSLAPKDSDGELVGGQFLNVFSLEYQYQLFENWRVATFADTGRTFISSKDPFHTGAGIGLRWQLPLGMFAFDVARPISDDDGDKWRLHIYMSSLL